MQTKTKPKKPGIAASIQADTEPCRFAELRALFANEAKDETGKTQEPKPSTENLASLMLPDGCPPWQPQERLSSSPG